MKKILIFISFALLFNNVNLMAEEFIAKQARIEKEGKKVEVKDLNTLHIFHANYHPKENVVKIKCSAGNLTLKKGIFFYGYSGKQKAFLSFLTLQKAKLLSVKQ
jgi:hypothetical protein